MRRSLLLAVLGMMLASAATAARFELRILFDTDLNPNTGCTLNGFVGADEVLLTHVETTGPVAGTVTSVERQVCLNGILSAPIAELSGGWPVGFDAAGNAVVETRSAITTRPVRIGFAVGTAEAISFTYDPRRSGRQRAAARASTPVVTLDGIPTEWSRTSPAASGSAGRLFLLDIGTSLYIRFDGPLQRRPNPQPDTFSVRRAQTLGVPAPGVLANDLELDNIFQTVTLVQAPRHGSLSILPSGGFIYTHSGDDAALDTFVYGVSNGESTATATVTINITPDQAPVARPDSYTVARGGTLTVSAPGVLGNDSDADTPRTEWVLTIYARPGWGTLTLNRDGSFVYVHGGSANSHDSFIYTLSDRFSVSQATVLITVTP